jgi:hypoxanthine phosphoribosyltransferase
MTPRVHYTTENMRIDLKKILEDIRVSKFEPDIIVGIARGGLVAATYLSHAFNKPMMSVKYSLRDHPDAKPEALAGVVDALIQGKRILVVDDICDGGETLCEISDCIYEMAHERSDDDSVAEQMFDYTPPPLPRVDTCIKYAVLINNQGQSRFFPDFVGTEINKSKDDVWIIFDWENL